MTSLINQALFRIDPTEGLLLYAEAIKPYHSKVLDVLVEYVYTEPMMVTAQDRYRLNIGLPVIDPEDPLRRTSTDVTYTRGYGLAYDAYSEDMVGGLPEATIISAHGPIKLVCTFAGTVVTASPDPSEYVLANDTQVSIATTGSFPTTVPAIRAGETLYIVGVSGNTFSLSRTQGGTPMSFTDSGVGTITIIPQGLPVNSFVIAPPTPDPYQLAVVSIANNQLAFVNAFPVVGVDRTLQTWTISGNHLTTIQQAGQVYINDNADPTANRTYTVASVSYSSGPNLTVITVTEPLSLAASATGTLYTTKAADAIPFWPGGSAIRFNTTGTLPAPLQPNVTYYVVPTSVASVFRLSTVRFPARSDQVVDFITQGSGTITAQRVEPFLPGELVRVSGSYQGINDQTYVLQHLFPEGPNFRAFVREFVEQTTPASLTTDGTMSFVGTYGDPAGEIVSAPQLYTATYFHERIDFNFGPTPVSAYLLDTFAGIGNLRGHVSNSGHTWSTFQLTDDIEEIIFVGSTGVTTADTEIWVRSNWTPPTAPTTTSLEFEVYVKEKPESSSPYFRGYIKETNVVTFYGPHIDVYPTADGMIELQLWLGDDTVGTFHTIPTGINANQTITVKLELTTQSQVVVYVNGTSVFTSVPVTWPSLSYVGFNFRVPASDTSQFTLYRIQAE